MPGDLNLRWSSRLSVAPSCVLASVLVAAAWRPAAPAIAVILAVLLAALDLRLISFFRSRSGGIVAARAMTWHFVYYLCCAAGAVAGTLVHLVCKGCSRC